eukprot:1141779-Pelagomonas_calceolata.AAC.3
MRDLCGPAAAKMVQVMAAFKACSKSAAVTMPPEMFMAVELSSRVQLAVPTRAEEHGCSKYLHTNSINAHNTCKSKKSKRYRAVYKLRGQSLPRERASGSA